MRFGSAASVSAVLLLLVACETTSPSLPPIQPPLQPNVESLPPLALPNEIKIGLLLPFSGPVGDLGQDMLKAAQMALFDVGESQVVLLPRDTKGTAAAAEQAANALLGEGAELLIGPLFSQEVNAVTPIAQAADRRVLAFSNVATGAAPGTFLLGFRPEEQVERVVQHALRQGYSRIAALAPDDAYGATALEAFRRAVIQGGGELAETLAYPPDLADPSAVVREIADYDERQQALEKEKKQLEGRTDDGSKQALQRLETLDTLGAPPFDAILIADGGDRLRSVASLLTFYDVDPAAIKFLGTIRWQDDPRVLSEGALQGGWFAAPSPQVTNAFVDRFRSTYGRPPQQLAALAYDATALAVYTERDLRDRTFAATTLTESEGFTGAAGLFRLRPDGLADHGLAILEVASGGAREVDPPPARFVDQLVYDNPYAQQPPAATYSTPGYPAPANGPNAPAAGQVAPDPFTTR